VLHNLWNVEKSTGNCRMFFKRTEKGVGTKDPLDRVRLLFAGPYVIRLRCGTDLAMKNVGDYEVTNGEEDS